MILDNINSPEDIKKLNKDEKIKLAGEIRKEILEVVSKNGGHLASNLGIVELTIAMHSIFDFSQDKIIWDVGHQIYVHKLLTGRKDKFKTLRKSGGLAGFPKTSESKYDHFNTGHSSTSISIALGMARARDIKKKDYKVIALIGDGALTGGMALEALNDAGNSKTNITVILNDNEMSISKNTGGISRMLTKLRTKKVYTKSNSIVKNILKKIPFIGEKIIRLIKIVKKSIKQLIFPKMYFEDIGFKYLGPVDGHNIEDLENLLKNSENVDGPVLIHVVTKKGKGYKPAEDTPNKYHSTGAFDLKTLQKKNSGKDDYSKVFGKKLTKLAEENKNIVAITAAMEDGTGLNEFASKYPDRFFNVEIAEEHALGLAAGMAKSGLKPFVPIYSSFLQRGYDQIVHDICLQKMPVVICIDRSGIVGNDGETHQGLLDMAFLNTIPNMNIMAPKDFKEFERMIEFASRFNEPISIRYPRGGENVNIEFKNCQDIELGRAEKILEGEDLSIIAIGKMTSYAYIVANRLKQEKNIKAEVINARFLKPIDKNMIIESAKKTGLVVTLEDGTISGGLATTVNNILKDEKFSNVKNIAYPDEFVKHGDVSQIEKDYSIDYEGITNTILKLLKEKRNI